MSRIVAELVVEGQQVFVRAMDDSEDAVRRVGGGAEQSERKLSGFTAAMGALGGALATRELVQWGNDAAQYSRELGAMQTKAETVLGDHVDQIRDFSTEHAARFGLAQDELTGLAAGYADLLVPMGFTRQRSAELTEGALLLAGALGEWTPELGGAEHALGALGAAMTGEREQLKGYGIVIDEAAVQAELLARGLDDLTGEAERQAEAQATLDLALRGSTDAQARFAAGGDPAIVAAAESKAAYAEMRAELGENLLPILSTAQGLFADVVGVVGALPEPVQTAGLALVGIGTAAIPIASTARALQDLGVTTGGVRGAVSSLSGFMTGPFGAAMLAGGLALNAWKEEAEEAQRIGETFYDLLRDNADLPATDRLTEQDLTRDLLESEIAARGLREEMAGLGVTTADIVRAVGSEFGTLEGITYGFGETLQDFVATPFDFLPGVDRSSQAQLIELIRDVRKGVEEQSDAWYVNEGRQLAVAEAARMVGHYSVIQHEALTALAPQHDSIQAAIDTHTRAQQALARETQVATIGLTGQRDLMRGIADPFFAASQAQQRLADAQERLDSADNPAERISAQEDVARAAGDLHGVLIDLDQAQSAGETSSSLFGESLRGLEAAGLVAEGALGGLIGRYDELTEAARNASIAMLGTAVQSGTAGYPDSIIREALVSAPAEPATRSALRAESPVSVGGVQVGSVTFNGVDPSRPEEPQRLVDEWMERLEIAQAKNDAAP